MLKAMFIGAHLDECEYGVGGVAYLLKQKGVETFFYNPATFLHEPPTEEERAVATRQSDEAAALLGAKKEVDPNTARATSWMCTPEHELLIQRKIEEYQPDLLFIQYPRDNHPEHVEVAKASYLAISHAASHIHIKEIYMYEAGIWQTVDYFKPHFAIDITSVMDVVEQSILCFNHHHANGESLLDQKRTVAHYRGLQHLVKYAEAYRILKYPDNGEDFILRRLLEEYFKWNGRMQYPGEGHDFF